MSYILLGIILLLVMLGVVAFFDETRARVRAMRQQSDVNGHQKRMEQAFRMKGQLYQMDPGAFQKWIIRIYEDCGYRVRPIEDEEGRSLLLEKEGICILVGCLNYRWPISQEVVEILHHKTKQMRLEKLVVISTSGFNANAEEWAGEQPDVELIVEDKLFDLCQAASLSDKEKIATSNAPATS
jgi:hypothetical protein